jgi:hypothetical protein
VRCSGQQEGTMGTGPARVLVATAAACLCWGCGTLYRDDYYKFSGAVVDAATGALIQRAAL